MKTKYELGEKVTITGVVNKIEFKAGDNEPSYYLIGVKSQIPESEIVGKYEQPKETPVVDLDGEVDDEF